MDPFLEEPGLWPDVHHGLISQMQAELNQMLGPKYFVRVESRVYISDEDDPGRTVIIPDLRVSDRPPAPPPPGAEPGQNTLAVVEPLILTTLVEEEIREAFLEVRDRTTRQVVTVIEVVSPSNKVAGSRGRESYQQKRREVVNSASHWVEIDLLRAGVPLIPAVAGRGDYFVHVSRANLRPRGMVWPIHLPQRLPVILIPLLPDDPDARLDLQPVLETVYARGAYDRVIDYRAEPVPPLPPQHATWADALLRGKGLR
jgi:hypothetical protein